ncbi:hypothetical protein VTO42DRAFT_7335 [Malbranchea cinnamomea]
MKEINSLHQNSVAWHTASRSRPSFTSKMLKLQVWYDRTDQETESRSWSNRSKSPKYTSQDPKAGTVVLSKRTPYFKVFIDDPMSLSRNSLSYFSRQK